MVEITVTEGKSFLTNYAWMPIESLLKQEGQAGSLFEVTFPKCIKRMLSSAHFKGKNTYVSIPAFGGLITLIDFPQMPKEDIEQAIKFEAHKYIPISLEEVAISWDIVGEIDGSAGAPKNQENQNTNDSENGEGKKIQVLLVAASKNKVVKYENLVKNIGLRLKSIEIEVFSMANSLVGNDQGNFVIIDIGSRVCNIILISKGIILSNRNIDSGGNDLTRTIATSMNIDEERAEDLKISGKNFFSKESSINFPSLEMIIGETTRLIDASVKKQQIDKIDSIILSGGSGKLTGLTEYLGSTLGINAIIGNPLGRVGYDRRLQPVIEKIQTNFSVCIGLALRGAEEYINGIK